MHSLSCTMVKCPPKHNSTLAHRGVVSCHIMYSQVPRTYHGGVSGTFMNSNMHNKLFAKIDYNTDRSFFWEAVSGADG